MTTHWHILGVGAIGGLFAHRLSALGHRVTLIRRKPSPENYSLTLERDGDSLTRSFPCENPESTGPINLLLVCTKAFDVVPAVESIASRLTEDADVVLLTNGMGYHDAIADLVAPARLIAGATTAGCHCPKPHRRVAAGVGVTEFGPLNGMRPAPVWFEALDQADWHCHWRNNMRQVLLRKLAINCAINPATALHDVDNGVLLSEPYRAEFDAAIREIATLFSLSGYGELAAQLPETIVQVARDTAKNSSSMRSDLRAGRRTEVETILGYLLGDFRHRSRSEAAPLEDPDTPVLSRWLRTLRQLEQGPE